MRTRLHTSRLTALVSDAESTLIAKKAEAAGLSVSAYLRASALGPETSSDDETALRQIDLPIAHMASDLDGAVAEVNAALSRMAAS